MIDLTRALYLGLVHPHAQLAPWPMLTSGQPAALGEPASTRTHARRLARLMGFASATLAPSTLHVVTDLYAALPARVRAIHVHACSYAITQWGLERARLRGTAIRSFRSVRELAACLEPCAAIVCDAICVTCRRVAPLVALQQLAARTNGWLVIDDSQGLGLLGARPSRALPYGRGGAGTLRWTGAARDRVIAIGSCAKALGVPLAFVAASEPVVAWFEATSGTRTYASPCNAASVAGLDAALRHNEDRGDELRARLLDRIRRFRSAVALRGGCLEPGTFPVQTTRPLPACAARALHDRLRRRGVRAFRVRGDRGTSRIGFAVTAAHDADAIDLAGAIAGDELARRRC
ncbi:MAG TPA: aminotransferase class I/II-fold pyridoxal phosphate-dependent enzyme [Kofleriaceae bacterium]|nr:aminotransferase class I/II-fold pyridoxal phosphate-dependent enzyme [Kofleriaceae bacterium]